MLTSHRRAGAAHVDPQRSELGFRPFSGFLERFECRSLFFLVGDRRLDLQALSDSIQVGHAGALDREWLLPGLSCPVVADQFVGAFLQGLVREIGFPLDDCSPFFHLARGGEQGLFNGFRRRLRECNGRNRQYAENDRYHTFHSVASSSFAWNFLPRGFANSSLGDCMQYIGQQLWREEFPRDSPAGGGERPGSPTFATTAA